VHNPHSVRFITDTPYGVFPLPERALHGYTRNNDATIRVMHDVHVRFIAIR